MTPNTPEATDRLDAKALLEGITDPSGWQAMNDYDGRSVVITNVDGEIVDGITHYSYSFIATCEDEYGETPPNAAANARLIAAAPRLAREHAEMADEITALKAEIARLREALPWRDGADAPKDGTLIAGLVSMRWTAYKPGARKQGFPAGRWQMRCDYGGWEMCDPPERFLPHPDLTPSPTTSRRS